VLLPGAAAAPGASCESADVTVSQLPPPEQAMAFKAEMDAMLQSHWNELQADCEQLYHKHFACDLPDGLVDAKRTDRHAPPREYSVQSTESRKTTRGKCLPPIHASSDLRRIASAERSSKRSHSEQKRVAPPEISSSERSLLTHASTVEATSTLTLAKHSKSYQNESTPHDILGFRYASERRGFTEFFELETSKRYMNLLKESFKEVEEVKAEQLRRANTSCCARFMKACRENTEHVFDVAIGFLICLNAIVLGLHMDAKNHGAAGWIVVDACFCFVYCFEVGLKLYIHGYHDHFCGKDHFSHIFDASLVFIDLVQLILSLVPQVEKAMSDAPSAALFRVMRLAKISRILRLLRSSVFKDLLAMMQGMIGGMQTLGWAMVLFVGVLYIASLIFRDSLGRVNEEDSDIENVSDMFNSVPKSMFTTFRCSFGDCSASEGKPIFEHVSRNFSAWSSVMYCFFLFLVTIGLFNVISAIFLEATISAAHRLADDKKQARLNDNRLWLTRVASLVSRLIEISNESRDGRQHMSVRSVPELLEKSCADIQAVSVPWKDVQTWSHDPEVLRALADLDINQHDCAYLSDILDPDNNGRITIIELMDGLRRLRGFPRRSDILTVDMMVRSLQNDVGRLLQRFDLS